ncbi:MAG: hypothetical protein SPJ25_07790, partial [Prevotella sp.]|nr:hypothetical protein [Prevotella sp.]
NILIDGIQHRNQDRGIVWINVSLGYRPLDLQVSNLLSTFIVGIYLIVYLCKLAIDRIQVIGEYDFLIDISNLFFSFSDFKAHFRLHKYKEIVTPETLNNINSVDFYHFS